MTEWKPIETAPKDGKWFIAYRKPTKLPWDTFVPVLWCQDVGDFIWPDHRRMNTDPYTAVADDEGWIEAGDYYRARGTFTHWMPLPAAP